MEVKGYHTFSFPFRVWFGLRGVWICLCLDVGSDSSVQHPVDCSIAGVFPQCMQEKEQEATRLLEEGIASVNGGGVVGLLV